MRNKGIIFLALYAQIISVFGNPLNLCEKCINDGLIGYTDEEDKFVCTSKAQLKRVVHSGVFSDFSSCVLAEKIVRKFGSENEIARFVNGEESKESHPILHTRTIDIPALTTTTTISSVQKSTTAPAPILMVPKNKDLDEKITSTQQPTRLTEDQSLFHSTTFENSEVMEKSSIPTVLNEEESLSTDYESSTIWNDMKPTLKSNEDESSMYEKETEAQTKSIFFDQRSSSATETTTVVTMSSTDGGNDDDETSTQKESWNEESTTDQQITESSTILSVISEQSSTSSRPRPYPFTVWTTSLGNYTTFNSLLMSKFTTAFCKSFYFADQLARADSRFKFLQKWNLYSPIILGYAPRCHLNRLRKADAKKKPMTVEQMIARNFPQFCTSTRYGLRLARHDYRFRHLLTWINESPAFDNTFYDCQFLEQYYQRLLKN